MKFKTLQTFAAETSDNHFGLVADIKKEECRTIYNHSWSVKQEGWSEHADRNEWKTRRKEYMCSRGLSVVGLEVGQNCPPPSQLPRCVWAAGSQPAARFLPPEGSCHGRRHTPGRSDPLWCFKSVNSSIQLLGLVDSDARDEGQPSGDPLLVLHIVLSEKVNEGELLLLYSLPEEPPAGYRVADYTNRITQQDLQKQNM